MADHNEDIRAKTNISKIEEIVGALETALKENAQDPIISETFPVLIRNLEIWPKEHGYELITGQAFYTELDRVANKSRVRKLGDPDAVLRTLAQGIFGGKYPGYAHLNQLGLRELGDEVCEIYNSRHSRVALVGFKEPKEQHP